MFASLRNTMFAEVIEDNNIVEHSDIIIREEADGASDDEMLGSLNNHNISHAHEESKSVLNEE